MKRIVVLLLALLWAVTAFAQYVPEWHQGELKRRGTKLAVLDEKLDKEATLALLTQVGGTDMADAWEKACSLRGWGIGLTSGGYTLAAAGFCFGGIYILAGVVGTIFAAIGGQEAVDKLWADLGPNVTIGGVVMGVGLAAGTTGVVLLCVGNGNLRKMTRTADAAGLPPLTDVQLTFGPTPSGMGLALRF
jgi:hypothetical protein